jgi:RNA polymerase sigma-70 factor (ECF subfamily)
MKAETPSDSELVSDFQRGSEQAFNLLALRYRRSVFLTASGLLGIAEEADDLTQEVFVKVYESLKSFRGDSQFYTWIYRITVNLCLNHLRKRKTRTFHSVDDAAHFLPATETADAQAETAELSIRLRAAIESLPEKQKLVFILRHFRSLPHAEIARILDRDEGTIKANYFQAVRKLRAKLGNYVRGEE